MGVDGGDVTMTKSAAAPGARGAHQPRLQLRLAGFAQRAIEQESSHMGVSITELAEFAVLYYLADLDSGRIARRIPPLSAPQCGSDS
jgi:hypothetical protein